MGEILGLSDLHATYRPPSSCTDAYWPDLLGLLWQSVDLARERQVMAVVWAGDVLHHKAAVRTSYSVILDLIRVIKAYPCPVLITPGNHDITHDRLDSIDATQPLGVLYQAGAQRLEGWADGNLPVYGVPWLQDWSETTVAAALAGFGGTVFSRTLVVTHAPIYPPDRAPRYEGAEHTPASWWSGAIEGFPGCHGLFYGHIHEPHGVWEHGGVRFCNNGAVSRGSLDEYNLEREVGCTIWDSLTGEFTFAPLKATPAADLFRLRERERAVTSKAVLDGFLEDVGSAQFGVLSVEGVLAHFRTLDLGPGEYALAEELLTTAAYEAR